MTYRFGACGHPLRPDDECRVCSLLATSYASERTAELHPAWWTVTVTDVSPARVDDVVVSDASGFIQGQAVDFVPTPSNRLVAWREWNDHRDEANAYEFFVALHEVRDMFPKLDHRGFATWMTNLGFRCQPAEGLLGWQIYVYGADHAVAETFLRHRRGVPLKPGFHADRDVPIVQRYYDADGYPVRI